MKQPVVAKQIVFGIILLITGILPLCAEEGSAANTRGDSVPYAEGILLFFDQQYDQAAVQFAEAEKQAPDNPVYSYFLGLCCYRQGDLQQADTYFRAGADKEWTNLGRLIDVGSHLRRIQGEERMTIESIRQEKKKQWQEDEAARQKALYGETLNRQKEYLSGLRVTVAGPAASADQTVSVQADSLPSVPPIAPLDREEKPGRESEELAAAGDDLIVILRDEYTDDNGELKLKTSMSTMTQQRKKLQEKRNMYKNPDTRPAADGSEFIDIYDEKLIVKDDKPFFDPNEPVEPEKPAEQAKATSSFFTKVGAFAQKYGNLIAPSGTGPDIKAASSELFGGADAANPFADQQAEAAAPGAIDPFKADRAYQPK